MVTVRGIAVVALGVSLMGVAPWRSAIAEDAKEVPNEVRTFTLTNTLDQNDLNDLQTALRNVLPHSRLYAVPTERKIVISGSPNDLAEAQKLIGELDQPKKLYRVTYTITDIDGGKRIGTQHFALILVSGGKTDLKHGSKVPIVTGSYNTGGTPHEAETQVQYLDVGLQIEANLEGAEEGVKLRSKVVQSALGEQPSDFNKQDPVIRETSLEGTASLIPGKPLILGSIDIPGSTRHQDVEVVAELVK